MVEALGLYMETASYSERTSEEGLSPCMARLGHHIEDWMSRFDWKKFCDSNRIIYVTSGPNVADAPWHLPHRSASWAGTKHV